MSQLSIGRKVSAYKVKRFHAQKCLELTPQPFPTQSYVGKINARFRRKTHDFILCLKHFAIMCWLVEALLQTL